MATTRSTNDVITAAIWNALANKLTDDGNTYSGAFNGSTVAGTTGSFSSTLAVTGAATFSGLVTANAAISATAITLTTLGSAAAGKIGFQSNLLVFCGGSSGHTFLASGGGNLASIDTSGNVTAQGNLVATGTVSAAAQPGFLAYNSVDDTTISSGTNVDFDTEVYDEGGDFASDTFTAPVAGRYLLSASVMFSNVSGGALDIGAYIRTSNFTNGYYIGYRESVANNDQIQFSGSVIVDMDASDTATVQVYLASGSITVRGGTTGNTWFCGRLLP